jgi:hypothetical protein
MKAVEESNKDVLIKAKTNNKKIKTEPSPITIPMLCGCTLIIKAPHENICSKA